MDFAEKIWSWISSNSNGIGVILSLVGFGILWYQTWQTRTSAEASRVASAQAVQTISDNDTIADLSLIRAELGHLQVSLRDKHYEVALLQTQALRERFHQIRTRRGFTTDARHTEIQEIVTFLKKLQDRLERQCSEPESTSIVIATVNGRVSDIGVKTAEWIEEIRFTLGGSRNDR
jgi:hypothetical protein